MRTAKWLPMLLTLVGSVAVAAGLFVAVLTMTRTPVDHRGIGLSGTVYVGESTCFTCHKDQTHNWSQMLSLDLITNPLANPQSGVQDVSVRTEVAPLLVGGGNTVEAAPSEDWDAGQHYVIATEDAAAPMSGTPMPDTSEDLRLNALDLTCTLCHTRQVIRPGGAWLL